MNRKKQRRLIGLMGVVTPSVAIVLIGSSNLIMASSESSWMTLVISIFSYIWTVGCLVVIVAMLCDYESTKGLHDGICLLGIGILVVTLFLPGSPGNSATVTGWDYVVVGSIFVWVISHAWIVIWDKKYIKGVCRKQEQNKDSYQR